MSKRPVQIRVNDVAHKILNDFCGHIMFPGLELAFVLNDRTFIATVENLEAPGMINRELTCVYIVQPRENVNLIFEFI